MSIDVTDLTFSYGAQPVLKGLTFSAREGELIAVLGQNGAGKSTLFRCILGFLHTYGGSITCSGADLRGIPPRELARRIAYIPQSSVPVFNYTVLDAVLMGTASQMSVLRAPREDQERQAKNVLEELGIGHLQYKGFGHISGGERQLALIARALVQQAGILIMDEPTANLDYGNQFRVLDKIRSLTGGGYTVLMSTHNPEQAFRFATRVLLLHEGQLLADGTPEEVLTRENIARVFGVDVVLSRQEYGGETFTTCAPVGYSETVRTGPGEEAAKP